MTEDRRTSETLGHLKLSRRAFGATILTATIAGGYAGKASAAVDYKKPGERWTVRHEQCERAFSLVYDFTVKTLYDDQTPANQNFAYMKSKADFLHLRTGNNAYEKASQDLATLSIAEQPLSFYATKPPDDWENNVEEYLGNLHQHITVPFYNTRDSEIARNYRSQTLINIRASSRLKDYMTIGYMLTTPMESPYHYYWPYGEELHKVMVDARKSGLLADLEAIEENDVIKLKGVNDKCYDFSSNSCVQSENDDCNLNSDGSPTAMSDICD